MIKILFSFAILLGLGSTNAIGSEFTMILSANMVGRCQR